MKVNFSPINFLDIPKYRRLMSLYSLDPSGLIRTSLIVHSALKQNDNTERPPQQFNLMFDSPFFESNPEIIIYDTKSNRDVKSSLTSADGSIGAEDNKLVLGFRPQEPGVYTGLLKITKKNYLPQQKVIILMEKKLGLLLYQKQEVKV